MKERFRSKYLDIPNAPLYPFGYGLSYTTFAVSDVVLDQNEMDKNGRIAAKVTVKNTGDAAGCEVVQMYIRDDYSDVVRPVKELKGFRKVELAPGEEQEVTFYITEEDLQLLPARRNLRQRAGYLYGDDRQQQYDGKQCGIYIKINWEKKGETYGENNEKWN